MSLAEWVNGVDPLWTNLLVVALLTGIWGLIDALEVALKKRKEQDRR